MTNPLTLSVMAEEMLRLLDTCGGAGCVDGDLSRSWVDAGLFDSRELIHALLTTIEKAGYKVVPVEATSAMVMAGIAERHDQPVPEAWSLATKNIWSAMLSHVPKIGEE